MGAWVDGGWVLEWMVSGCLSGWWVGVLLDGGSKGRRVIEDGYVIF